MIDLRPFVGIPYRDLLSSPGAWDGCYGLVCRVYREVLGIELELGPSGARSREEVLQAERSLLKAAADLDWHPVAHSSGRGLVWDKPPELLDVIYCRVAGHPHVGLVASPDGLSMLHAYVPIGASGIPTEEALDAASSHIDRIDRALWARAPRVVYRHPSRA